MTHAPVPAQESRPFKARLTRAPLAYDAGAGADGVALFADAAPEVAEVLRGAAGCSPYLKHLMAREQAWLAGALDGAPEAALSDALGALDGVALPDLGSALRQAKRRVAVLAALADLGGVWALEDVTGALTALADRAVNDTLAALVGDEIRRGKLPGMGPDDAATGAGMFVLAMGKMGAHELNYSSDIDLICLFDETRYDADSFHDARAAFVRVTRKMMSLIADITSEGYVFRNDMRLRPDPSVTPVCLSTDAAERYYESIGRTWERAAFIKARPCGGDIAAGWKFLRTLTPFVWRKHLDFAAIQDAHDMRLRIRAHKGYGGKLVLDGHNMKLGQGGIREIEFFTQTRQLIAGGRDPDLRARDTVGGLRALAAKGWLPGDVARDLEGHYTCHREVEHRLQMVQDAQTQLLPNSPDGFDRLARFMGQGDTDAWQRDLKARLTHVAELTEGFFAPSETCARPALSDKAETLVAGWRSYPALRSDRAREVFARVEPELLSRMQRAANPDEALGQFDRFLSGLPAGVQVFSLFEANPQLIDLVVDICATAPRLSAYLSRNAGVFDAVIGGDFFAPWPDRAALTADLTARLSGITDYERQLDAARVWAREWHFRVGVHHLRGLIDPFEAGHHYATLADAVLAGLWPCVVDAFAAKHGAPPGRGAVVLGMGSLGAGRLNAASDLDLIVIYDADGVEASDGRRPLDARPYYARLTQAFVTALTAATAEGRLYEVDMRLRPSGRQGPVATSLQAFESYQRDEAWTWEHLALSRARAVAGNARLGAEVEDFRVALLAEKGQGADVRADTAAMRARLASAKPGAGQWDVKDGAGRLQDIELTAQLCALIAGSPARRVEAQLRAGARAGVIDAGAEGDLVGAYRLCWRLQCAGRLLTDHLSRMDDLGAGGQSLILRETGFESLDALSAALAASAATAAARVDAVMNDTRGRLDVEEKEHTP
ncbi:glutamine-synthetase adenylyltransferase [Roseicitreum antarcticum]|nr:glutamine-synthetase adenylyltransferase [Roseicitreum antarcticum]